MPWYIAAKSPMLFTVTRNHPQSVVDSLVFLGMNLGELEDSGLEWVASDSNAAAKIAEFSTDLSALGTFVDFELLGARMWNKTNEDPNRASRRAAEILVHDHVPLELVSVVVARKSEVLDEARALFSSHGYSRVQFRESAAFTF